MLALKASSTEANFHSTQSLAAPPLFLIPINLLPAAHPKSHSYTMTTRTPTPCSSCPCCVAHSITFTNLTSTSNIPDATIAAIMKAVYFDTGEYFNAVARVRNTSALWLYQRTRQAENPEEKSREWEGMVAGFRKSRKGSKWVNIMSLPPGYVRVGTGEEEREVEGEVESDQIVEEEQEREIVEDGEQEEREVAATTPKQPTWTEVQVVQKKEQEQEQEEPEQEQEQLEQEPEELEQEPEPQPEPQPEPEQIRTRFEVSAALAGGW